MILDLLVINKIFFKLPHSQFKLSLPLQIAKKS